MSVNWTRLKEHLVETRAKLVLANAFSINMIGRDLARLTFRKIDLEKAKDLVLYWIRKGKEVKSIIGHESTAKLASELLNYPIQTNREFYTMNKDVILVIQVKERLQEGQILDKEALMKLYQEGKIEFWLVY